MTNDNFCFHLQNRLIQTSQTGGQWYSDTSPFSIPCKNTTVSINDTTGHMLSVVLLPVAFLICFAECRYAQCFYGESHYTECRGTQSAKVCPRSNVF
jgi:hypothetical protein